MSEVVVGDPADFESWNNLGNARRGADDFEGSIQALAARRGAGARFSPDPA